EVKTATDYLADRSYWNDQAEQVVFTGKIDEYFGFQLGELEYRTLKFDTNVVQSENVQGNAVVNYTESNVPWSRIIEHKHFEPGGRKTSSSVITKEIPDDWSREKVPYYPIGDKANTEMFKQYEALAAKEKGVIFGGRLSEYKYYDMHQVIGSAMSKFARLSGG